MNRQILGVTLRLQRAIGLALCALVLNCAAPQVDSGAAGESESNRARRSYGKTMSNLSFRPNQGQYILVSFWATWCGPCRKELPYLEGLARAFAKEQELVVVAVNFKEEKETVQGFLDRNEKLTMQVTSDRDGQVSQRFRVKGIPTLVLLDPNDQVLWQHSGYTPESFNELIRNVSEIVKRDAPGGSASAPAN